MHARLSIRRGHIDQDRRESGIFRALSGPISAVPCLGRMVFPEVADAPLNKSSMDRLGREREAHRNGSVSARRLGFHLDPLGYVESTLR